MCWVVTTNVWLPNRKARCHGLFVLAALRPCRPFQIPFLRLQLPMKYYVVFADERTPSKTNPVLGPQGSVMLLLNPSGVLQHSFGRLHHALRWSNARQHSPVECQSSSAACNACDLDTFRGITEISSTGNQGLCLTKKFGEGASSGRAPRRCRISRLFTETLHPPSSTIRSGHIRLECHYIQDSTLLPIRGVLIGPSITPPSIISPT